jgi:hypothetical protein
LFDSFDRLFLTETTLFIDDARLSALATTSSKKGRPWRPFLLSVMNGFGNATDAALQFADKEDYQFFVSTFPGSVGS